MHAIKSNVVDVISGKIEKKTVFFGDRIMDAGENKTAEKTYDISS